VLTEHLRSRSVSYKDSVNLEEVFRSSTDSICALMIVSVQVALSIENTDSP
jgi:hypothetical protein